LDVAIKKPLAPSITRIYSLHASFLHLAAPFGAAFLSRNQPLLIGVGSEPELPPQ
jgi:hypothetical protein